MTGNEAIVFVFIFIIFGGGASIFTFIAGSLIWEKLRDHGVEIEFIREKRK